MRHPPRRGDIAFSMLDPLYYRYLTTQEQIVSVEEILKKATMYHDLNPKNFDEIFTPDFKGEHWQLKMVSLLTSPMSQKVKDSLSL